MQLGFWNPDSALHPGSEKVVDIPARAEATGFVWTFLEGNRTKYKQVSGKQRRMKRKLLGVCLWNIQPEMLLFLNSQGDFKSTCLLWYTQGSETINIGLSRIWLPHVKNKIYIQLCTFRLLLLPNLATTQKVEWTMTLQAAEGGIHVKSHSMGFCSHWVLWTVSSHWKFRLRCFRDGSERRVV